MAAVVWLVGRTLVVVSCSTRCLTLLRGWTSCSWLMKRSLCSQHSSSSPPVTHCCFFIARSLLLLFSPLGKLAGRAICFARIVFLIGAKVLRICWTYFYHFFPPWMWLIWSSFFQFLKVGCHGNQFYVKIWVCAFIRHSGVPKPIIISPLQLKSIQCIFAFFNKSTKISKRFTGVTAPNITKFVNDVGPVAPSILKSSLS